VPSSSKAINIANYDEDSSGSEFEVENIIDTTFEDEEEGEDKESKLKNFSLIYFTRFVLRS
jgi:hypothetical protein